MPFFYLSQVLGRNVCNAQNEPIAKIKDLVARLEVGEGEQTRSVPYPSISALVVRVGQQDVFVPWNQVATLDAGGARLTSARLDLRGFERRDGEVMLRRDMLDRQLIDIDGRRVIRANDLQLYGTGATVRVMAVDVSGEALLRRLSFGRLFVKTAVGRSGGKGATSRSRLRRNRLGTRPPELINWPDIEPLKAGSDGVQLRLPHDRLALLNPVDLANIVDELGFESGMEIIESLDDEIAADTLQEMSEERQADIVERMDQERAADILEEMEPDDAADLLGDLDEDRAQDLLRRMDREEAEDVEELLRYAEESAGGMMTSEFLVIPARLTVDSTLALLRGLEETPAFLGYLYVVEEESEIDRIHLADEESSRLLGVVSLRDLLLSAGATLVSDIMATDLVWAHPDDPSDKAVHLISEYNLLALPVLDREERLLGIITVDDVMEVVVPERQLRRLPRVFRAR